MYWKLCGLGAWAVDGDSVSVHHGLAKAMVTRLAGDGRANNSGGRDLTVGVREEKEGWPVHHPRCHCAEGQWV
jgi:hypothetical protein